MSGRYVPCPQCKGNGIVINAKREWLPCDCEAGVRFVVELRKGEADLKAGRGTKWADIRRTL